MGASEGYFGNVVFATHLLMANLPLTESLLPGVQKKAALNTRAAALLSSKLGKPSKTREGYCRPTPGGDYNALLVKSLPSHGRKVVSYSVHKTFALQGG